MRERELQQREHDIELQRRRIDRHARCAPGSARENRPRWRGRRPASCRRDIAAGRPSRDPRRDRRDARVPSRESRRCGRRARGNCRAGNRREPARRAAAFGAWARSQASVRCAIGCGRRAQRRKRACQSSICNCAALSSVTPSPHFGERRRAPVETVQRGERVDEIGREAVAPRALERLSLRAPGQRRVPLDLLAKEERRAENGRIIAGEINARRRHGAAFERLSESIFRHRAIGREQPIGRPDAQDHFAACAKPRELDAIGDPGESGGKFGQPLDDDGRAARLAKERGRDARASALASSNAGLAPDAAACGSLNPRILVADSDAPHPIG